MVRCLLIAALLLVSAASPGLSSPAPVRHSAGSQYALLWALPAQEAQAKRRFHRLADSGNTADMRNASAAYTEELVAMVVRVAGRCYPPGHFGPQGIRPRLEALLDAQGKLGYDILDVTGNPFDIGQDSILGLDGESSTQVEDVLKDMVEAISEPGAAGPGFDDIRWLAAWNKAEATGD